MRLLTIHDFARSKISSAHQVINLIFSFFPCSKAVPGNLAHQEEGRLPRPPNLPTSSMKRKKWSDHEEQTLLAKYSELSSTGSLSKLRTREKKFKPIADHVNSIYHLQDPISYPFKWTWRDVSIKVQNMRNQYLGVKQKIRVSDTEFNWNDGENLWENFLRYKEVFGDVELNEVKDGSNKGVDGGCGVGEFLEGSRGYGAVDAEEDDDDDGGGGGGFGLGLGSGLGLGFGIDGDDLDQDEEEDHGQGNSGEFVGEMEGNGVVSGGSARAKRSKRRKLALPGAQVSEPRDMTVRREEGRRGREFVRDQEDLRRAKGEVKQKREGDAEEASAAEKLELELKELKATWARRESERRLEWERAMEEGRQWRMRMEEKREEEDMEWRERLIGMQMEHEKQMMQMQADACQNQLQILGVMVRLMCQFFGSANDGLGALPPQVLQSLQHQGGLGDNGKPDANSPSEFM